MNLLSKITVNDDVTLCKEKRFYCSFKRISNREINYILYHFLFNVIE